MSRYIVKGVPFRTKCAVNVEDCTTSEEVIKKAGLDWSVDKCYIYAAMLSNGNVECPIQDSFNEDGVNYAPIDNSYGIYRTDKNIPLGIVKDRYTTVQNIDAFKFFDKAIGKIKLFGKQLVLLVMVKEYLLVLNYLIIFLLKMML